MFKINDVPLPVRILIIVIAVLVLAFVIKPENAKTSKFVKEVKVDKHNDTVYQPNTNHFKLFLACFMGNNNRSTN